MAFNGDIKQSKWKTAWFACALMIVTTVYWFVEETSPQMVKYGWEWLVPHDKILWSCYWSGYSFSLMIRGLCTGAACRDVRQPAENTAVVWGSDQVWSDSSKLLVGETFIILRSVGRTKRCKMKRSEALLCSWFNLEFESSRQRLRQRREGES